MTNYQEGSIYKLDKDTSQNPNWCLLVDRASKEDAQNHGEDKGSKLLGGKGEEETIENCPKSWK